MGRKCSNVATVTAPVRYRIYNDKNYNETKLEESKCSSTVYGWICPVCGRGLSPYTSECSCYLITQCINSNSSSSSSSNSTVTLR